MPAPGQLTRTMVRRGAEIVGFGLLFRLQEYLIAWGWAPWTDLFRVDVLNVIGLSMILMALLYGFVLRVARADVTAWRRELQLQQARAESTQAEPASPRSVVAALAVVVLIALLTPLLYTTWRPTWLPWEIESYIDGCHNLGAPQPWLFCMFPWAGFAFAGLAAGAILFSDWAREHTAQVLAWFACDWRGRHLDCPRIRPFVVPALLHLRLLAHQSQLLHDARWHAFADRFPRLRVVPLGPCNAGCGHLRIQPAYSARPGFPARLLGSH